MTKSQFPNHGKHVYVSVSQYCYNHLHFSNNKETMAANIFNPMNNLRSRSFLNHAKNLRHTQRPTVQLMLTDQEGSPPAVQFHFLARSRSRISWPVTGIPRSVIFNPHRNRLRPRAREEILGRIFLSVLSRILAPPLRARPAEEWRAERRSRRREERGEQQRLRRKKPSRSRLGVGRKGS